MQSTTPRPRAVLGALVASIALTLTACGAPAATPSPSAEPTVAASATATPTPTPTATPTPVPVSTSIEGFSVDGAFGEKPAVSFPTPFAIDATKTRVVVEGPAGGPAITPESIVEVNYAGINARTGTTFDSSFDGGSATIMSLQQVVPGFRDGLVGKKAGDRVLIVMPGADGYDGSGGNAAIGVEVGDSLTFVVDVLASSVTKAEGEALSPALPVQLAADDAGNPTVTIPPGATPPSAVLAEPVIRGVQRPVAETDYVMVLYRGYSWKTGALIEDKYATPDAGPLSGTIDAWKQGLVGKPIGSRVVIVAPNAYPNGNPTPAIEAGDTIVYVVDILFSSSVV